MENEEKAVNEQYKTSEKLQIRMSIHQKYSTNRQGFGNWIFSHYCIENGMSVLELGCGTGEMWAGKDDLIARCSRLILSDLSEGMIEQAKRNVNQYGNLSFETIDIQDIPYPDNAFDIVIANMMLYHVPDIPKGLAEVRRVLKENGTFYSATYGEHGMMEYLCGLLGLEDHTNRRFTLQNGKEQLLRFFADVRRDDYRDSLEITDAEDMADYIFSLSGLSELRRMPREQLLAALRKNMSGGKLCIPKEYGLFISK